MYVENDSMFHPVIEVFWRLLLHSVFTQLLNLIHCLFVFWHVIPLMKHICIIHILMQQDFIWFQVLSFYIKVLPTIDFCAKDIHHFLCVKEPLLLNVLTMKEAMQCSEIAWIQKYMYYNVCRLCHLMSKILYMELRKKFSWRTGVLHFNTVHMEFNIYILVNVAKKSWVNNWN